MVDVTQPDIFVVTAPCGCTSGAIVARIGLGSNIVLRTPEQAAAEFYETTKERFKAEREGFTMRGISGEEFERDVRPAWTDCTHEPKWGVGR